MGNKDHTKESRADRDQEINKSRQDRRKAMRDGKTITKNGRRSKS